VIHNHTSDQALIVDSICLLVLPSCAFGIHVSVNNAYPVSCVLTLAGGKIILFHGVHSQFQIVTLFSDKVMLSLSDPVLWMTSSHDVENVTQESFHTSKKVLHVSDILHDKVSHEITIPDEVGRTILFTTLIHETVAVVDHALPARSLIVNSKLQFHVKLYEAELSHTIGSLNHVTVAITS